VSFGINTSIRNLNLASMLSRRLSHLQAAILRLHPRLGLTENKTTSIANTKQVKAPYRRIRQGTQRMSGGGPSTPSRNLAIGFMTWVLFGFLGVALKVANVIQSTLNWLEREN